MSDARIGATAPPPRRTWSWVVNMLLFVGLFAAANYGAGAFLASSLALPDPVYPWSWPPWALDWYPHYPSIVRRGVLIFGGGTIASLFAFAAGLLLVSRRGSAVDGLHGTAHWADRREIEFSGLLAAPDGVYVGGWMDRKGQLHYLRHSGPEHVLAFAPTRSGKGVSLVLPTLLSWPHSVVVYDPKGEAWALTAGWRKQHAEQLALRFDPASPDPGVARFNPLEEIRVGAATEVGDAQNVATILVDPDGKGLNDHWSKTSHALLSGAILHCCYATPREHGRPATLADVVAMFSDPDKPIDEVLAEMLDYPHLSDGETHPLVAQEARTMLNKEDRELSSVLSTAISYLTLYRDPVVARNTSRSDFRIEDLMQHSAPLSVYLVVRPSDADRLRPLVRLIATQIVRRLTERLDFADGHAVAHYKHRLLLLLDEFASLRRLPAIEESLAYMGGYGIKAYLIVQDLQQLLAVYGREESLLGNCHVRIAFAPNKIETAELVSKMSGQQTVVRRQVSLSGKRTGLRLSQASESVQEVSRPLITPDEAMRLPAAKKNAAGDIVEPGHMLIFAAGHAPIYGRQLLYFVDPVFSARSRVPPPETSDRLLRGRPEAAPPEEAPQSSAA